MAGGKPDSDLPGRPERPKPTIELTATEVTAVEAPPGDEPGGPAEPEPAVADTPPPEPPASPALPSRPSAGWGAVAGAVAGVAATLMVLLGLWAANLLTLGAPRDDDALNARFAALDARLRELADRPAPAPAPAQPDTRALDDLAARIARLESRPAAQPSADPALAERVSGAEAGAQRAAQAVAALEQQVQELVAATREARTRADAAAEQAQASQEAVRSDATAERRDLNALAERVAALERDARALTDELARRAQAGAVDRAARAALAGMALHDAVARGDPFADELAALKPFVSDAQQLAPLEPFAQSGLPDPRALGAELANLVPAMARRTEGPPREGSFLDRLQANAERLVRIRPVGEVAGDNPEATLVRVEARARQGDLAGALAELRKLPQEMREPAQAWMQKAEAREAALAASRRLAAAAMKDLGQP